MSRDCQHTAPDAQKAFFYTEECGLALMLDRRTNKKLAMEKALWADLVESIKAGTHPGAPASSLQPGP